MSDETRGTWLSAPPRDDEVHTVAVTPGVLVAIGGLATAVLLFASAVAFSAVRDRDEAAGSWRLGSENRELLDELGELERKLSTLDGQMAILLRRNEEIRTLADLPEIPTEVAAVGVGGPGHDAFGGLPAEDPVARRLAAAETDLDVLLRRSRLLSSSMTEAEAIIRGKAERWSATPSIWPTDGFLSSPFSFARRHPILGRFRPHYGVDISARSGNRVIATADGVVTVAARRIGSGNYVEIDHGYGIVTTYSHNAKLLVKKGDRVRRGTPVGLVGSTGFSLGPHVHYEVHKHGQPVDPTKFIFPNVVSD